MTAAYHEETPEELLGRVEEAAGLAAGATGEPVAGENGVALRDGPGRVTITISGRAFENLAEITRIFNRWNECDYTPAELLWFEHLSYSGWTVTLGDERPQRVRGEQTLPGLIRDLYTGAEDADELGRAFEAAGLSLGL